MEVLGAPNPKRIKQEVFSNAILVSFIDGFISMSQNSHYNFQIYLEVIPKIALLGTLPLSLFLERHIIKYLVTFALAESQKRDKQIIRAKDVLLLEKAIKILSMLVQKCQTNTRIIINLSPVGTRDLLAMPKDNLEVLYCMDLFKNAMKKRIALHNLTNIILHLSWENIDFSNKIISHFCQQIRTFRVHKFCLLASPLSPFLAMQDSQHPVRVAQTLESFLSELHRSTTDTNLDAVCFWKKTALGAPENTQGNATVRAWFIAHMDKWVPNWLLASGEIVQKECYSFIMEFIQSEGNTTKKAELKYTFVEYLLGLTSTINQHHNLFSWRIAHYARLLRELITEPSGRDLFAQHHEDFVLLLDQVNLRASAVDQSKRELCALWEHVLAHTPDLVRLAAQNQHARNFLLYFHAAITQNCSQYNADALPPYFRILRMCCEFPEFLIRARADPPKVVLNLLLYNSGAFPDMNAVWEIIHMCALDPSYRKGQTIVVVESQPQLVNLGTLPQLLRILLKTRHDVVHFCTAGGLGFLDKVLRMQIDGFLYYDQNKKHAFYAHLQSLVNVFLELLEHEPQGEPSSLTCDFAEYLNFYIELSHLLLQFTLHSPPPVYFSSMDSALHSYPSTHPPSPPSPASYLSPPIPSNSIPTYTPAPDSLPIPPSPSSPPLQHSPSAYHFVSSLSHTATPAKLCISVAIKTAFAAFCRFKNERIVVPSLSLGSCNEVLSLLLVIWNHDLCGPMLQTDISFSSLVSSILGDGFVFFCDEPQRQIILMFYRHISATLISSDKFRLLSGLTEQLSRVTKMCTETGNPELQAQATKTFGMVLDADPELQAQVSMEQLPVFADDISSLLDL